MNDGKQIAADLFARFSAGDIAGVLDLMTDDVTWRLPGKPELLATAGVYDNLRNGRQYRQQYHFAITLRDGKIAAVHEYLDTLHVHDVWIRA